MVSGNFEFRGQGGELLWLSIWTGFLTTITIGIYFPWAYCRRQEWIAANTYIEGKRLQFHGTGSELFGNWLVIALLSTITLGFYLPWGYCKLERWRNKNTSFAETFTIDNTLSEAAAAV